VNVVKVPASKARPARLLVEVNPVGKSPTPRKRRGLFLADEETRGDFLQTLNHPDLGPLLHAINLVNSPSICTQGKLLPKTSTRTLPPTNTQVTPPNKAKVLPTRDPLPPEVFVALPDFDLAVSERGTLPVRARRVLRVSDRAVLVSNTSGREIWIPKMALCKHSASPAAPQSAPWVFSVKGWFVKKRDFQEWLRDNK